MNKESLKIIGWTDWDNDEYKEISNLNLDKDPDHWKKLQIYEDVLINYLKKTGYKFCGDSHQYGNYGCPVFNDGTKLAVTQRHWGYIMAKALDIKEEYAYCIWAWSNDEEKYYPSNNPLENLIEYDISIETEKELEDLIGDLKI